MARSNFHQLWDAAKVWMYLIMSNFVLAVIIPIYLLPTIIAIIRRQEYLPVILGINILLGWTFIGWIVVLVMAIKG